MEKSDQTQLYTYSATVVRVIDGDTLVLDIDLGFHVTMRGQVIRLARIDAPETRGSTRPAGEAAKIYLTERLKSKAIVIKTSRDKTGKFGRMIAEVFRIDTREPVNINDLMVTAGHAIYRKF